MSNSRKHCLNNVEALLSKAQEAERRNTEEALELSKEALVLSEEYGYQEQIAKSHMRIGRCYWINSDFFQAINHLGQSLELATKIEDYVTQAEALIGLGNVYITMEFTDQALNNYHTALKIVQEKALDEQESKLLNNLGTLHEDLQDYHQALDYYQKSYLKACSHEDEYGKAIANLNIGNVYLNLNQLDLSLENIQKAYQHAIENNQTLLLAHSYYSFGQYYQKTEDYSKSIQKLKLGIVSAEESKDFYILVRSYVELANAYDNHKNTTEARLHFEKAYDLAKQMNSVEFMPRVHEQLARFYERHDLKEKAYTHYKAYFDSSKIVQENRRNERIKNIEFQTKLNTAIQETETYRVLSKELEKNFRQMQVLSDIGRSMTATHDLSDIFNQLYENINKLMHVDTLVLGFHNQEKKRLDFDLYIEESVRQESFSLDLENRKSLSVYSFLNRETIKMNDVREEYKKYIQGVASSRGDLMLSAMFAPLVVEEVTIGIVSIQAKQRNTYTETHKVLLETLASYLAIAIKNARDTIELARLNKRLKSLSEQDGLTGIPNRRLFDEMYSHLWSHSEEKKQPLSLLIIDIDDFKDFNDTYGHLTGDEVIINVAHFLRDNKHENHFLARYGGDEFVIILPNTYLDDAHQYAQRLKDLIVEMKHIESINGAVRVSIGLATVEPHPTLHRDDFFDFTDQQLYESKKKGKNAVTARHYNRQ